MSTKDLKVDWNGGLKFTEYAKDGDGGDNLSARENVDFYNKNAEHYDHDMVVSEWISYKHAATAIHKYLKGKVESRILDLGAGTGLVMKELQALAPYNNADGLDASAGMLAVAKQNNRYKQVFHQYFAVNSGIEHNSYDLIVCSGALGPGHIEPDAIMEICDIIKPDGYVVVVGRQLYFQKDPSCQQMMSKVQQMVEQQKIVIAEHTTFENYSPGYDGFTLVLQKL